MRRPREFLAAIRRNSCSSSARHAPLWGFVEEDTTVGQLLTTVTGSGTAPLGTLREATENCFRPLYLSKIEALWGGTKRPKWPDRIVFVGAAPWSDRERARASCSFWHGVSLASWFVSPKGRILTARRWLDLKNVLCQGSGAACGDRMSGR